MHAITISEKEAKDLKESGEGALWEARRKGREKYYNSMEIFAVMPMPHGSVLLKPWL